MQKYRENILVGGEPVAGASVTVRSRATGSVATLYSDNGVTQRANPVITDDLGMFSFYAADGRYDLLIEKSGVGAITPLSITDVLLEDPQDGVAVGVAVESVNGVLPNGAGDVTLTTANVSEDTNLYHTATRVRAVALTGLSLATNAAITAADTVLSAFGKLQKQLTDLIAAKDASGGYAGLTLFKLNMRNAADTFTSFLTNANTAARTYTLPDADGTLALTSDIGVGGGSMILLGSATVSSPVSTIEFLNIFTSAYDSYLIEVDGLTVSADAALFIRCAIAGSVDSLSRYYYLTADGAAVSTSGTSLQVSPIAYATGKGIAGTTRIVNANRATLKGIFSDLIAQTNSTSFQYFAKGGAYNTTSVASGFQLSLNTGTINGGVVRVYGHKNT